MLQVIKVGTSSLVRIEKKSINISALSLLCETVRNLRELGEASSTTVNAFKHHSHTIGVELVVRSGRAFSIETAPLAHSALASANSLLVAHQQK